MVSVTFGVISPSAQALIAANRFCAVFLPTRYAALFPPTRSVALYMLAIAPSALLCISAALSLFGDVHAHAALCWFPPVNDSSSAAARLHRVSLATLGSLLPTGVALACYSSVYARIRLAKTSASRRVLARRARGSLMMFSSFVLYLLLIAPAWTDWLFLWTSREDSVLWQWFLLVNTSSSCINLVCASMCRTLNMNGGFSYRTCTCLFSSRASPATDDEWRI